MALDDKMGLNSPVKTSLGEIQIVTKYTFLTIKFCLTKKKQKKKTAAAEHKCIVGCASAQSGPATLTGV